MSEPLTEAEIAELHDVEKRARLSDLVWDTEWQEKASDALPRLLDEVERARALLRRVEWGGCDRAGHCPECGGGQPLKHRRRELIGHRPGCELAALIGQEIGLTMGSRSGS